MKHISVIALSILVFIMTASTKAYATDNITLIEDNDNNNGYVNATFNVSNTVDLPLSLRLKGGNGILDFTIAYDSQVFQMLPGEYKILSARDGNGNIVPNGSYLTITDTDSEYYLDFSQSGNEIHTFNFKGLILINITFLILALFIYIALHWFKTNLL